MRGGDHKKFWKWALFVFTGFLVLQTYGALAVSQGGSAGSFRVHFRVFFRGFLRLSSFFFVPMQGQEREYEREYEKVLAGQGFLFV